MNNLLVISELCDYKKAQKRHFSLTKGYYISLGFSKIIDTYCSFTSSTLHESIKLSTIKSVNGFRINDFIIKKV